MSTAALLRLATRNQPHRTLFRSTHCCPTAARRLTPCLTGGYGRANPFSTSVRRRSADSPHGEETFEEFSARYTPQHANTEQAPEQREALFANGRLADRDPFAYEKEFEGVQDVFELQRNLNNCFAYDLVPSPSVITAALRAARRVNDFPTAVRIFE
ncbi:MAG: hypothetical protein LQ348_004443, partial [Seirophora lacunosa]